MPLDAGTLPFNVTLAGEGGSPTIPDFPASVTAKIVEDFDARAGVSLSGSDVTSWTGQVAGIVLTANGAPTVTTSPSGADRLAFDGTAFLQKADGIGSLPTGTTAVEIIMVGRCATDGPASRWAGFSYGGTGSHQSRGIIISGDTDTISYDIRDEHTSGVALENNADFIVRGSISAAAVGRFQYGISVADAGRDFSADSPVGGSARINVMCSWGSLPRKGWVDRILILNAPLTDTEWTQVKDILNAIHLADYTGVTVSNVSFTPTGETTGTVTFDAPAGSRVALQLDENAGTPTKDEVFNAATVILTSALDDTFNTVNVAGLTADTTYYPHMAGEDYLGNRGASITGTSGTTDSGAASVTDIAPNSGSVSSSAAPGTTIITLSADAPVASWSLGGVPPGSVAIEALSATTARLYLTSAISAGDYTINVVADSYNENFALTVNAASSSADYTTTYASLRTLLSGWGGTVPEGRAVVVEISGAGSAPDLSGIQLDFPAIIMPAAGTYGMSIDGNHFPTITNPAKMTGTMNLTNAANIQFWRIWHSGRTTFDNCSDITFYRCALTGPTEFPYNQAKDQVGTLRYNNTDGYASTRLTIDSCYFAWFRDAHIDIGNSTDCKIINNVFGATRGDTLKTRTNSNLEISRNWGPTVIVIAVDANGNTLHTDFWQPDNKPETNVLFWGNLMIRPSYTNSGGHVLQGAFMKGGTAAQSQTGLRIQQNILATNAQNGYYAWGPTVDCIAEYNDCIRQEVGAVGSAQTAAYPTFRNDTSSGFSPNLQTRRNIVTGATATQLNGAGSNSRVVNIGAMPQPSFAAMAASGLYSGYPHELTNSIAWTRPPSTAAQSHWSTTDLNGPVGAYLRKKEIWADGIHPGNVGWPVDAPWRKRFNEDDAVPSTCRSNSPTYSTAGTYLSA